MANLKRKASDEYVLDMPFSKRIRIQLEENEESDIDNLYDFEDTGKCEDGVHELKTSKLYCDRYCVKKKLDSGGCSTVWLCWDTQNECEVALKVVNSHPSHTEAAMHEILMLECVKPKRRLSRSNQKHTADNRCRKFNQLLDDFIIYGTNCSHTCLVLELMQGDLIDLFNTDGGEMAFTHAKSIIKQILEGLDYFHTKCQLIHTDLKAENILYKIDKNYSFESETTSKVTVKIADLGSACSVHNPKSMGCQTQLFRSNEFIYHAPYSTSADIWSMACLAFFLCTGDDLFESQAGEGYTVNEDHLACTIALLGEIPKHVALSGKYSNRFFTKDGKLRHQTEREPKMLISLLLDKYNWDVVEACDFADFLLSMLDFDPKKRASARQCLKHPWINKDY